MTTKEMREKCCVNCNDAGMGCVFHDCKCHPDLIILDEVSNVDENMYTFNFDLTDKEKDWLNMIVKKAFEAPFYKMAVRHAMFRLYEKGKRDTKTALSLQRKELAEKVESLRKSPQDVMSAFNFQKNEMIVRHMEGYSDALDSVLALLDPKE